jgi:DHA1 family solute carrier family 18 vesicular amine transporter 1/2
MPPAALRRLALLLGSVIALDMTMYSSVTPLLPELRDSVGLSGAEPGVLVGSYAIGLLVFAIPSGWVTGRVGAKASVVAGALLLAVASVTFGVADSAAVLILARFLQGVASALQWAGAMTWLIGASSPSRHGVVIGTVISSAVAGSIVGPLLGVVSAATDRALVFPVIAVVAMVLSLWLRGREKPLGGGAFSLRVVLRAVWHPWFATLIWVVTLCAGSFGALAVIAPLRMDALGGSATLIGAAFFTGAALEMAVGPIVGRVSDLHGRRLPMGAAMVTAGAVLVAWYVAGSLWPSLVLLALAWPAIGLMVTPAVAGMTDFGRAHALSIAGIAGLTNFIWALGEAVGALGAGLLVGAGRAALGSAVLAVLLLATLCLLRVRDDPVADT